MFSTGANVLTVAQPPAMPRCRGKEKEWRVTGIAEAVQTSTELRKPLTALVNKGCVPVGGIFRLDYDSAVVLTDDFKKHEAGGVPRGGFLFAVAGENTDSGFMLEDQEVILLRVRGTAPLPNESELIQ